MQSNLENSIIELIGINGAISSKTIYEQLADKGSYATVKRTLTKLLAQQLIVKLGNAKNTTYALSSHYRLFQPVFVDEYFSKEIDEREITNHFNFDLLLYILPSANLFTATELKQLDQLHQYYSKKVALLPTGAYQKELERLAIDLSWKSSQIEGNTYSLLETEYLLKEKTTAPGKTSYEASMLLNHKKAIDFIIEYPDYMLPLSIAKIENIHRLLVNDLAIDNNIRKGSVGITGTNYKPLDNEIVLREALEAACNLINQQQHPIQQALLAVLLISYIQPFTDGNKRTARIISNAILMNHQYCPLSYRTADSITYKKALLIFYEQNNLVPFKQLFIEQYTFAVNTYF